MCDFPAGAGVTTAQLSGDPHPVLARLRAAEPVSWLPALDGWLVTRRDLAEQVLRDARGFTVDDPRFTTARVVGPSMLSLDGAQHRRHRDPFARALRRGDVGSRLAQFCAGAAGRLVAGLAPAGSGELRRGVAGPLAVAVMAEVLGLGDVDQALLLSWYDEIVAGVSALTAAAEGVGDGGSAVSEAVAGGAVAGLAGGAVAGGGVAGGVGGAVPPAVAAAFENLSASLTTVISAPAASSMLAVAATSAGLTTTEIVSNAAVMLFGGIETTEGMICNALLHLLGGASDAGDASGTTDSRGTGGAESSGGAGGLRGRVGGGGSGGAGAWSGVSEAGGVPAPLAEVRADRSLIEGAIDESLRLEPAAAVVDRYATADVRLGDADIRARDLVVVSLAGANRDPDFFPEPDTFDIRRPNARQNLGFALGPHFCVGAQLARMETQAAIEAVLDRLPGLRLDQTRLSPPRGLVFRKPPALYALWEPA